MTVDWGRWEPFHGSPGRELRELDRASARRYFGALMGARDERKRQLEALLGRNGLQISPDDAGLQTLDDWYRRHVSADDTDPNRLTDRWYAVGLDIGLYLGDALIERAPTLEWRLFTHGRTSASYQRPVVMGYRRVKNPRYNVDPERLVGIHGHRIVAGEDEPGDLFVQIVRSGAEKA